MSEDEISFDVAKKFSGYLEKKSKGIITKWQKRYFHILEGKIMVYAEKPEDIEIKGLFILDQISIPQSLSPREFSFLLEGRDFVFRVNTPQEKEKWIKVITLLKAKLTESKSLKKVGSRESSISLPKKDPNVKSSKKNKLATAGKVTADIIRRNGFVTNKEQKISSNLIKAKGIDKLINVKDPKINARINYGFIYKKHKVQNYYQKRWFFIFSSRPLSNNDYIEDETDLESKKQKDWMKFDCLFYFKYEDKDAKSESQGSLDLAKSHKIELLDKDEKYYLYLDVEDRRLELYCDSKAERDIWFEALKNSRRTAKEYQASFTKHPRNVELLYSYFKESEKDFTKKIEKEKTAIIGNYEEVEEYDIFEFNQNNLQYAIESTIDGCNSIDPPKKDLLKAYSEYMNKEYLNIVKNFWDRKYKDFEHANIIKLSMMLFMFYDRLFDLNVNDQNFSKNGKELAKIYLKKTYQNVLSVIENILRKEREVKAIIHDMGYYYTQGPNDLFEFLSQTFDLLKENKNKHIYEMAIDLFNSCINQYLLGEETVLNNLDIVMEKEFLLSMANNSLNIIQLLNSLIENIKEMEVLKEEEINEFIKLRKIMMRINRISQKSIITFVFNFLNDLGNHFKIKSFIDLDMTKILVSTNQIFGPYKQYMNILVLKKSWNEILKMTLYHYIHLLLTSSLTKVTVEQIKEKIKNDHSLISETYEGLVGKNLTESTIRILSDIRDFLDVSPYMISSSCLTLRQYIGPSFNLAKAKALIKLRTDFKEEDLADGVEQCKEVLDNYQEEKKDEADSMNYFQLIELEMKRREAEERRIQREKEREREKELKKNQKILKKNKKKAEAEEGGEEDEEEEGAEEEEEEVDEEKEDDIVQYNLDDFLDGDEEEEKEDDDKPSKFAVEEEDKDVIQEEVSDITHEGYMQKKSHSSWQKRYFQIKGGYLYWFKDKTSSLVQNKISIRNTLRVDSHKEKKFMMIVKESDDNIDEEDEKEKKKAKEAGGKIYKFACQTDEEKREWVTAITTEMKRLKKQSEENKDVKNKLEIPVRKKIITDYFDLPNFDKDLKYMKKKVLEEMNNENYFQPSLRKIEALKKKAKREEKERKRKEKEELERKKQQEKEERERKKREEKEEKIRKNNEMKAEKKKKKIEENKKIEEDLKSGKKVGLKNRIKFWFRTNVEGIKKEPEHGIGEGNDNILNFLNNNNGGEEDNQMNENENKDANGVNEFNMDDFLNDDEEENDPNKENNNENNNNINVNQSEINTNTNTDNNNNIINNNETNDNINNNNNEIKISENNNINEININDILNDDEIKTDPNTTPTAINEEKNIINNNKPQNNNIINKENSNSNISNTNTNTNNPSTKNEQPNKMKSWFKNKFNFGGKKNQNQEEPKKEIETKEKTEEEKAKEAEAEKERIELEKIQEMLRLENERIEQENKRRIKKQKEKKKNEIEKEEKEKAERERIERENAERERIRKDEREKIQKEIQERENAEKERNRLDMLEKQKREDERLERERQEKERFEIEKQRLEKEMQEQIMKERLENERLKRELELQKEREREKENKERELELEREKQLKLEEDKKKEEFSKLTKKQKKQKLEQERLAKELQEKERQKQLELEQERLENERKERQRRLEQERIERERLEEQRLEQERIENERLEQERLEREKKEKERLEKEKQEKIKKRMKTSYFYLDEENSKTSTEYKNKLLPKIRKDERKVEKLYKSLYSYQNQLKVEEKYEKLKENIPNIKSKYDLLIEENSNMEENKINNEEKNDDKPVNDWWGDIFK